MLNRETIDIIIKEIDGKTFLTQLALAMKSEASPGFNQLLVDIPEEFGEGRITGSVWKENVGFILFNFSMLKRINAIIDVATDPPMMLLYSVEGNFELSNPETGETALIKPFHPCFVVNAKNNLSALSFPANQHLTLAMMFVKRGHFIRQLKNSGTMLPSRLAELTRDESSVESFYINGS